MSGGTSHITSPYIEKQHRDPALCDHFIEVDDDPWAGTYCKLPAGHDGPHSAHYPAAGKRA